MNTKKTKLAESIQERLDKYTITGLDGWDAEEEYERIGTKDGVGYQWGGVSNPRGATWKDYVNYINKDDNSNDYTNYKTVEGGLEYALAENLLQHFIELNQNKKMRRREILKYIHKYVEGTDGTIVNDSAAAFYSQKVNESEVDSETYKQVIEGLSYFNGKWLNTSETKESESIVLPLSKGVEKKNKNELTQLVDKLGIDKEEEIEKKTINEIRQVIINKFEELQRRVEELEKEPLQSKIGFNEQLTENNEAIPSLKNNYLLQSYQQLVRELKELEPYLEHQYFLEWKVEINQLKETNLGSQISEEKKRKLVELTDKIIINRQSISKIFKEKIDEKEKKESW